MKLYLLIAAALAGLIGPAYFAPQKNRSHHRPDEGPWVVGKKVVYKHGEALTPFTQRTSSYGASPDGTWLVAVASEWPGQPGGEVVSFSVTHKTTRPLLRLPESAQESAIFGWPSPDVALVEAAWAGADKTISTRTALVSSAGLSTEIDHQEGLALNEMPRIWTADDVNHLVWTVGKADNGYLARAVGVAGANVLNIPLPMIRDLEPGAPVVMDGKVAVEYRQRPSLGPEAALAGGGVGQGPRLPVFIIDVKAAVARKGTWDEFQAAFPKAGAPPELRADTQNHLVTNGPARANVRGLWLVATDNQTSPQSRCLIDTGVDPLVELSEKANLLTYLKDGVLHAVPIETISRDEFDKQMKDAVHDWAVDTAKMMGVALNIYSADYDGLLPMQGQFNDGIQPYMKDIDGLEDFTFIQSGVGLSGVGADGTLGWVQTAYGRATVHGDGSVTWDPNPPVLAYMDKPRKPANPFSSSISFEN